MRLIVSHEKKINSSVGNLWELISSKEHLNLVHPFCKINEAIEEMAKTEKYDLILYQGVAYASKEIDITDKLIKVLSKTK